MKLLSAVTAILLLLAFQVVAEENILTANAKGSIGIVGAKGNTFLQESDQAIGGRLQLETRGDILDLTGFIRVDILSDIDLGSTDTDSRVKEAWLRYRTTQADFIIGRQLMPNGKTDVIVLQDQFSPRDLTQVAMTEQEQRLGVTAIRMDIFLNDSFSSTIGIIQQDQSYILLKWLTDILPESEAVSEDPVNAVLLRGNYRHGALELSAAYTNGASPFPGVSLKNGQLKTASPDEQRLAIDGTYSLNEGILRWDIIYVDTSTDYFPGYSRQRWAASIGWDQGLWRDTNLSLQFINRNDHHLSEALVNMTNLDVIFSTNRQLSQAFNSHQYWATAALTQRIRTEHHIETSILVGSEQQYGFIQRWTWTLIDNWSLRFKAQLTQGDVNTLLGLTRPDKLVYAEFRYQF